MLDRRITPARADLAAAYLKGEVEAEHFAEGEKLMSLRGHNPMRAAPDSHAEQQTELLCGEGFTVYEQKNGWAWGQIASDGYVGYVHVLSLCPHVEATHRVRALSTPLLTRPNVEAASLGALPMNAVVRLEQECGDFFQTNAGYVTYRHLAPQGEFATDFVSVAERFLGVPYVWGGKTVAGLDCSGLIQTALQAAGISAPRDTDMMEKALGLPIYDAQRGDVAPEARRGDIVFWKGHMGVMLDATRLLHANAFHMEVFIEPLEEAVRRIEKSGSPVTSIKRL
jgi:cell wall-associated NlpC family hydrolase